MTILPCLNNEMIKELIPVIGHRVNHFKFRTVEIYNYPRNAKCKVNLKQFNLFRYRFCNNFYKLSYLSVKTFRY